MRFSFSTNAFTNFSVGEAITMIAAAGYEAVEILADSPHLYPPEVTDKKIGHLRDCLAETGLQVANINANTAMGFYGRAFWEPLFEPSLANPVREARRWRVQYTKKCIDLAVSLSAPCISITSGRMVPGTPPEEGLELLKTSLVEVLEYAAGRGIRLGIEYEPGLLIENSRELRKFLVEMDSPWLGANLDLGHSHVLGENSSEVIAALGKRIIHIHLEDIRKRKHYHLVPGSGEMDFAQIFKNLRRQGYDGFLTVELYTCFQNPGDAARRSLAYLQNIDGNLQKCVENKCSN